MSEMGTVAVGQSANDIVEQGAGGVLARARGLTELEGAASFVAEEFAYDDEATATELVRLAQGLLVFLSRVSVSEAATLTFWRLCERCGGHSSENCPSCNGLGSNERGGE